MTKLLPLKVGDRAFCKLCQCVVTIDRVRNGGKIIGHSNSGLPIPRWSYRKLPDRKEG